MTHERPASSAGPPTYPVSPNLPDPTPARARNLNLGCPPAYGLGVTHERPASPQARLHIRRPTAPRVTHERPASSAGPPTYLCAPGLFVPPAPLARTIEAVISHPDVVRKWRTSAPRPARARLRLPETRLVRPVTERSPNLKPDCTSAYGLGVTHERPAPPRARLHIRRLIPPRVTHERPASSAGPPTYPSTPDPAVRQLLWPWPSRLPTSRSLALQSP